MTSQDFLFYSLGIGFLILAGFLSYAAFHLVETLKRLKPILEDAEDISSDVDNIKNGIKYGLLNLLGVFTRERR